MSRYKFNSSISTVGITDAKVQQAILKLLENSLHLNTLLVREVASIKEQIRRQKVYFDSRINDLLSMETPDEEEVSG